MTDRVRMRGNTIITHENYAIEFGDFDTNSIENCIVFVDDIPFWSSPLNWIAVKILKRNYHKHYDSLSETKIGEDS